MVTADIEESAQNAVSTSRRQSAPPATSQVMYDPLANLLGAPRTCHERAKNCAFQFKMRGSTYHEDGGVVLQREARVWVS
jgi:hypothetical protein